MDEIKQGLQQVLDSRLQRYLFTEKEYEYEVAIIDDIEKLYRKKYGYMPSPLHAENLIKEKKELYDSWIKGLVRHNIGMDEPDPERINPLRYTRR